ncbi:MAG: GntR family transcriptional regulator [Rhodospirillales bacterium]|nr:GntR family transcriptional regulator [Rhodospirillales bacterium]
MFAGNLDDAKNTLASRLVDRLREAILTGALQPGSKINLDRTRELFEVSLSPLREALARLIADGLVEFVDNRGYRVAPVSLANLAEITQLRTEFECLALRNAIAAGNLSWEGDVIRALHRLNRTFRDAARPESFEQWEAAHSDFHLTLIAGCGMPQLLSFCRVLHNLNDRYRRIFLQTRPGDRNVGAEHSEIAEGAVARDVDFACGRLRDHIQRTGLNLRTHLSERMPA